MYAESNVFAAVRNSLPNNSSDIQEKGKLSESHSESDHIPKSEERYMFAMIYVNLKNLKKPAM